MKPSALILVSAVALSSCELYERWQGPPVKDGSVLSYGIKELGPDLDRPSVLRFYFSDATGEQMNLRVKGDHGERRFLLGTDLAARRDNPIQLPLTITATVGPVMFWLPPSLRRVGAVTPAGALGHVRNYKDWKVWDAVKEENGTTATHYFELETGMLVGFDLVQGPLEVAGTLMSLR